LRFDWRYPKPECATQETLPRRLPFSGEGATWSVPSAERGQWNRIELKRQSGDWSALLNGKALDEQSAQDAGLQLAVEDLPVEFASVLLMRAG
jgi:hypothetical protein